ncbi:major capsid protein [Pantoea cypripedii]|uniref:Major capsid protein E n=1 Tax=Pantoea cypripedii TaxID=55209 RepID=A0A6B9G9Z7_PANCY|nr:major capsid protein [Pantoea cypripedii]QGY29375.1 major capsid protein E [Pantoea cypripedii]
MKFNAFHNLSGQFVKPYGDGFLLSSLGIFTTRPSDTQIISVDSIEDVQREVTLSQARYSSSMSAINFPKAANITVQAPLHVYSSTITSQDWQGKRASGENRQLTAEDVVTTHAVKHYLQARRDVEYQMAQSLLHNTVEATHLREGPTIDWTEFWGIEQPSITVKTGLGDNVITEMQNAVTKLKKALGGWSSSIAQIYLLASPSLFTAIQGNPTAYQAALFGATSNDIIFPTELGAYDRFNLGRVTVIQVDDPLYQIKEGTGFMLATFGNIVEGDLSPYMTYVTPASRHAEVASGPVYPSYHYVIRDPRFMNYEVVSELSQIQIPMRPDFVLKVTMDDAA